MEVGAELEPRVRLLGFKVKAASREAPVAQKAAHILDADLRTHWSTGTNTKEWILIEIDETCLLSHIRIYNKSVLEWEITVGLRYKPEAFGKIRPRCEAPKRDVMYPMNYTPCRYVRISCLRGNPIAIFFIQPFGIPVTGLEPEFLPVVSYLSPHIIPHRQDTHDMHLQLLQDITSRLSVFLLHLETDLSNFADAAESNIRFLAMLVGPFYPILHIASERESTKVSLSFRDSDVLRNNQASILSVSSNFEPRKSRGTSSHLQTVSSSIVFRSDVVQMLLRKAYKDSNLRFLCRMAASALQKMIDDTNINVEDSVSMIDISSTKSDDMSKGQAITIAHFSDYSSLFGDEYALPDVIFDVNYLNVLDLASVEEGIFHFLYACASQPLLCSKLTDRNLDFWCTLPLIQALLPALRPSVNIPLDQIDDSFLPWKHSVVQHAVSQIVAMSSPMYNPLLRSCAGYLSSFSASHARAACVLIDLCTGPLSSWLPTVVAKADLAIELLEDLLAVIQTARYSINRARAALKYIILALSGCMDDVLAKYKDVKHKLLFLLELLEPFLDPALNVTRNTISFGDVSTVFSEKQERNSARALNIIRAAVCRHAVLPSLESQWRHGSVAPSVLLSILGPNILLPSDIDLCKFSPKVINGESHPVSSGSSNMHAGVSSSFSRSASSQENEGKIISSESAIKMDYSEDVSNLFVRTELKKQLMASLGSMSLIKNADNDNLESSTCTAEKILRNSSQDAFLLDHDFSAECYNLQADYLQLVNSQECEFCAVEFQRLAMDLASQHDITQEGHDAAINAFLLAAECYVNPFFIVSLRPTSKLMGQLKMVKSNTTNIKNSLQLSGDFEKDNRDLKAVATIENKRDKTILRLLLQAAKLDRNFQANSPEIEQYSFDSEVNQHNLEISDFDADSTDAVTLVRQNQLFLWCFVMKRLRMEQLASHEILLRCLLFLLQSATKLHCHPDEVIKIIIQSAENLNQMVTSLYHQEREGNMQSVQQKLCTIHRYWILLQSLVQASSGNDVGLDFKIGSRIGFQYGSLVPHFSWVQYIPKFSNSPFPLVRFLGWMAVSRNANNFLKERLFLVSELSQLTLLLSIFMDELSIVDNIVNQKTMVANPEQSESKEDVKENTEPGGLNQSYRDESFYVTHLDLQKFFPTIKNQFARFGEIILKAVGLYLKYLHCSSVPDLLPWFSDMCLSPYLIGENNSFCNGPGPIFKGHFASHARAIVMYILESIVHEHMEAIIPEMHNVSQMLISLCRTSYSDIALMNSVLCLLSPLISFSLKKVTVEEKLLNDSGLYQDFELTSFEELFRSIKYRTEDQEALEKQSIQGPLIIFVLGSIFTHLSLYRKQEILESLLMWVDFASEPPSLFYGYLSAFLKVMESCNIFLVQILKSLEICNTVETQHHHGTNISPYLTLKFLYDIPDIVDRNSLTEHKKEHSDGASLQDDQYSACCELSKEEIFEFSERSAVLISKIIPSIEASWKLHSQLATKLIIISARCFLLSRFLSLFSQKTNGLVEGQNEGTHCRNALEGLTKLFVTTVENKFWQVASVLLDYILRLPHYLFLECDINAISYGIKYFCSRAPKIMWRLQTAKWLSSLLVKGIQKVDENAESLVDMFCTLLSHFEPEQRYIALHHLGRVVGLNIYDKVAELSYTLEQKPVASDSAEDIPKSSISILVSSMWDKVATVALYDPSLLLRTLAMGLLLSFVPYAKRSQLQSFLVASDDILFKNGKICHSTEDSQLSHLSLGIFANACLYSPLEDIALIPEGVWKKLENLRMSRNGLKVMEKNICHALCQIKLDPANGKEALKEALLFSSVIKDTNSDFKKVHESILQVSSSMASVLSYFEFFSKKIELESQELEEAEIEMELLQKERAIQEVADTSQELCTNFPYDQDDSARLQKIKDNIKSLEKKILKEAIVSRRKKKLLMIKTRQKHLEDTASREMELLGELDRERANEAEREIERQRQLELERAKTKELQYNIDLERERQAQRELQRELENVESGVRPSRREFSSNPISRSRERYRDRQNNRSGQEVGPRPNSREQDTNNLLVSTSGPGSAVPTTVVLAGSRSFSGQPPTILHSKDRQDERSASYEDNIDTGRDSGDASSAGDPELASAFEGAGGGFGSTNRHGSRSGKSRQVVDRWERDSRREGKWERKHS